MSWQWWQVLLMIGATLRLTRFIVEDTLFQPVREWVESKEVAPGHYIPPVSFTTLLNCSWCTGMWISALVVGMSYSWSGFFYAWGVLSLAHVVGLESVIRERLEVD